MRTILLHGDSHLARFDREWLACLEDAAGGGCAINAAAGGSDSHDLLRRSELLARLEPWLVVLSVGANDMASWKRVGLDAFDDNVHGILASFPAAHLVVLGAPPVDESRQDAQRLRTNLEMDRYRSVTARACDDVGGVFVDACELLDAVAREDVDVHVEDGVHLSDAGYGVVVDALVAVVRSLAV